MTDYRAYVKSLSLMEALWWFIENRDGIDKTDIFFDLRERYREQQQKYKLIQAVKNLVSDIEGMQDGVNRDWFGNFSKYQEQDGPESSVAIEWPNLRISIDAVNAELAKLPADQGVSGNKITMMIVDEINEYEHGR